MIGRLFRQPATAQVECKNFGVDSVGAREHPGQPPVMRLHGSGRKIRRDDLPDPVVIHLNGVAGAFRGATDKPAGFQRGYN